MAPGPDGQQSVANFAKGIDAFKQRITALTVQAQKQIVQQGYQMLVVNATTTGGAYGSPVFTGRYRGSIRVGIGAPDTSVAPPPTPDQIRLARGAVKQLTKAQKGQVVPGVGRFSHVTRALGQASIRAMASADALAALEGLQPFKTVYLSNSVPYARMIEFGAHSMQVPDGVFRVTGAALATWAATKDFSLVTSAQ